MKLIIDIPDHVYDEYREGVMSMKNDCTIANAVFDGKPYEEKTGTWVELQRGMYVCSECGGGVIEEGKTRNFCSNCGAKMR